MFLQRVHFSRARPELCELAQIELSIPLFMSTQRFRTHTSLPKRMPIFNTPHNVEFLPLKSSLHVCSNDVEEYLYFISVRNCRGRRNTRTPSLISKDCLQASVPPSSGQSKDSPFNYFIFYTFNSMLPYTCSIQMQQPHPSTTLPCIPLASPIVQERHRIPLPLPRLALQRPPS